VRVLVTGAGRAIGQASALELAARGHEVVATARRMETIDHLDVAQKLELDVCDGASVDRALAAAGDLDAVVNNAGLTGNGPLEDFPLERLRAVFETNVIGPLQLIQRLVPAWRERGSGVIVNVSSVQGRVAPPLEGAYSSSKHALEAISETLHLELGHFGIRVVIIEPGYIAPGMKHEGDHQGPALYEELRRQWAGSESTLTGPGGRPGPELVAQAIADAVEDPDTALRVPVGADAQMVLGLRRQLEDGPFEQTMRDALNLRW
jgi:NAD(P)-dependent dehydrogenase (short-subunit alcohol dehydrogenase family)